MGAPRRKPIYLDGRLAKVCTKCAALKCLDDFYFEKKNTTDGRTSACKQCQQAANNARYEKVAEQKRAYSRKWYAENKERAYKSSREWIARNKEKNIQHKKKYRDLNKGKLSEYRKKRYHSNIEGEREYKQWHRKTFPELSRIDCAKRRAIKANATPAWADTKKIAEIYKEAERRKLVVDHVVPLRSKYVCGLHVEANLDLIDRSLNCKKSNRWWPDMPAY